ncbi:AAA family ATPase [Micromonospora sp. C95]|uniref:AAA family ATPase n=1 Tax=Micromonospora sp. C95 TaxID=2824882 RepID=UPI001B396B84|nr:AAA family ATPase [Micromonospora sp. C95]MBQ1026513.1 AAA family ATPase [Micromonospora sp. C95]
MHHLTVRVAWHDSEWNGAVCRDPRGNPYCLDLDRIRAERNDAQEEAAAGRSFAELDLTKRPACVAESGAFMNSTPWVRQFKHPYAELKPTAATHGQLRPTSVKVPEFSTFAVPFAWMLRKRSAEIENRLPEPLSPDEEPPFSSPWVFPAARQRELLGACFRRVTPGSSLAVFYTKSGHPLGDHINRLVVGVGRIDAMRGIIEYDAPAGQPTYPLWDRLISHSIRPDGTEGFLLPYHAYLKPTGDPAEDARRRELLAEITVAPDHAQLADFSYGSEVVTSDVLLSVLERSLEAVRAVIRHGVASGPWTEREEWLNARIAEAWADRGAFPGAGAVLEAIGLRLATSLLLELSRDGTLRPAEDPWPLLDALLCGRRPAPKKVYEADLAAARNTWTAMPRARRDFIMLLSRFALTTSAARRWLEPALRTAATERPVSDLDVIGNPYLVAEVDLGGRDDPPVSLAVVDRGLLPDPTVAVAAPLPSPSRVDSPGDARRVEAALVTVLRAAAEEGDALLSVDEALSRVTDLKLSPPLTVSTDWINGNIGADHRILRLVDLPTGDPTAPMRCLQLADLTERGRFLTKKLSVRAERILPSLNEDWQTLLRQAITDGGGEVDENNERHRTALAEQAVALEQITTRKLSVLVGPAGTGKTSVVGALLASAKLAADGVLLLAPTGKATVLLAQKTGARARNIAQFLHSLKRYDGQRQRVRFTGDSPYRQERTVVVDESSMLTEDHLVALLKALDLGHVQRLILVGDPSQLPPIGVGRPFADLVAYLAGAQGATDPAVAARADALARLSIELRTQDDRSSDILRLAALYNSETQPVDADSVLGELALNAGEQGAGDGAGGKDSDLRLVFWETTEQLRAKLLDELAAALGMTDPDDAQGYHAALGLTEQGWVPFGDHNGATGFQVLSPVRMREWGTFELNRLLQSHFRGAEQRRVRDRRGRSYGPEEIVRLDKVMLVSNGTRDGYDHGAKHKVRDYLANGEVGLVARESGGWFKIAFAGRERRHFDFWAAPNSAERVDLELAYALTVHKAQGSEFKTVFMVVPEQSKLLTRELLYTSLTRARQRLVLLVQGHDARQLREIAQPEHSETARRNTNLFTGGVRLTHLGVPFAEHLIHRTARGELVRSKSEVVIANLLHAAGLDYRYERPLPGERVGGTVHPDFTFDDAGDDPIIWEHLGMLDRPGYRASWERRRDWYAANGFELGRNLFVSEESGTGIDSVALAQQIEQIRDLL